MHKIDSFYSFVILIVISISICANAAEYSNINALPPSYNWIEYEFPSIDDSAPCDRTENSNAQIKALFFAQVHSLETDWPFFYTVAHRPMLTEVVLAGTGNAPNITLGAYHNDVLIEERCMAGPEVIPQNVDPLQHTKEDRYTISLPKEWIVEGLSIRIVAGSTDTLITKVTLGVGPAPELNLVQISMDLLDYNNGKEDPKMPADFMGNFASAIPATATRMGQFPARMVFDKIIMVNGDGDLVLACKEDLADRTSCGKYSDIRKMDQLAIVDRFAKAMRYATGDWSYTYYYGNSLNFSPGGWGGSKTFAGSGYTGVFLHEMGHALDLPHWGGHFNVSDPSSSKYNYPYGGVTGGAGGRGQSWNYYQNIGEYVSPICMETNNSKYGDERSDAMQRSHWCEEIRSDGKGPWDGFGDFSAYAIYRFMVGAEDPQGGTVPYFDQTVDYHLKKQSGQPLLVKNGNGERVLERHRMQPNVTSNAEKYNFMRPNEWNVPVYTVFGSYHPEYSPANILYAPLSYTGNLPKVIDPTDPDMFQMLQEREVYGDYFSSSKNLSFKFTYADGTSRVGVYPFGNPKTSGSTSSSPWRSDIFFYALTVPADEDLTKVELFYRPFKVSGTSSNSEGNINYANNNITPENFLDGATLISSWEGLVSPSNVVPENNIIITANDDNEPNEAALKAYDGINNSKWLTFNNTGWWHISYPENEERVVREYSIVSANDNPGRDPKNWTLEGSIDGVAWDELDERNNECFDNRFEKRSFKIDNATNYSHYKLIVSEVYDPSLDILQIAEIAFSEEVSDGNEPGQQGNCIVPGESSNRESSESTEEGSNTVNEGSSSGELNGSYNQSSDMFSFSSSSISDYIAGIQANRDFSIIISNRLIENDSGEMISIALYSLSGKLLLKRNNVGRYFQIPQLETDLQLVRIENNLGERKFNGLIRN